MKRIIGYEVELNCEPYNNWVDFQLSLKGVKKTITEMIACGYKRNNIKIVSIKQ